MYQVNTQCNERRNIVTHNLCFGMFSLSSETVSTSINLHTYSELMNITGELTFEYTLFYLRIKHILV